MKGAALIFTFALFFVVSFAQYSYPLREHIKGQRLKGSINFDAEDLQIIEYSYSPVFIDSQHGLNKDDKIAMLPRQPKGITFDQYGGYVTVDQIAGRALFYYFVESQNHSSSKPLVIWLNGGPGCSSVGVGTMTELSPFRVNFDGKTLWFNPYAWNSVANVLFLEPLPALDFHIPTALLIIKPVIRKLLWIPIFF